MDIRIKELCKQKGHTMSCLSEKTGIAYTTLYSIPNGNPTVGTLQKIAAALGVSFLELFDEKREESLYICSKCRVKIDAATDAPPPHEPKTGDSLLGFVEKCTEKITDSIGLIGLSKHLKTYGGDGVLISDIDDKFYDGFIAYLKTAKKSLNPSIVNVISDTYQKRMKSCFDEVLSKAKENSTVSLDVEA